MQEVIVKYNGDVAALGYDTEILNQNYAIITLPEEDILGLNSFREIEYIELPKRLSLARVDAADYSCVTQARGEAYGSLNGEGVIVAVIDSGIDYGHECFKNPDGTSRVIYIWDQTVAGRPPEGFLYGTEYTSAEIDTGVAEHNDYAGHGTAVAGIAAGNNGVAPAASIIAVKLGERDNIRFARTTEIMRAVKYVYDKALALNMPLAVNISYGTNDGAHDGNSLFERYIDDMTEQWKSVIVVASGNEGAAKHHFKHVIKQDEAVDIAFTVGASLKSLSISFWSHFVDTVSLEIICPSGTSTGALRHSFIPTVVHMCGSHLRIQYRQPNHYSNASELLFLIEAGDNDEVNQGIWTIRAKGLDIVDGKIDIWLPTIEEVTDKTAFLVPSVETTLTIPSSAHNVITVGGYDTATNNNAAFSGRGYTRRNVYVKPDLVAPAVNVESCRAGGGYGNFTGTSMAAPFVAGSAALIMQWGVVNGNDPFLYGQRIKAFLRKGARRDSGEYPNNRLGYGLLCLENTMKSLKEYNYK